MPKVFNLSCYVLFFFKKMGQFRPFSVFSFFQHITIQILNWLKRKWCAWDSNPGQQDGRCRRIHWAMAAPLGFILSVYYDSLCILRLFVYSTIYMCTLLSLCVYDHLYVCVPISVSILGSLCVYYNLYACTTISVCILRSLCVYYDLFVYTTISIWKLQSLLVYYDPFVYTRISMCKLQSLCVYYDIHSHPYIKLS